MNWEGEVGVRKGEIKLYGTTDTGVTKRTEDNNGEDQRKRKISEGRRKTP